MKNILIVGSTHGIGLEFTRQYLKNGSLVFGVSKDWDEFGDLLQLGSEHPDRLVLFPVDVTENSTPQDLYEMIGHYTDRIDVFINLTDIYSSPGNGKSAFEDLDRLALVKNIHTSAISPLMIIQSMLPLLQNSQAPIVLNITSVADSKVNSSRDGSFTTSASQAALKMYMKIIAGELDDDGIKVELIARYSSDVMRSNSETAQLDDAEYVTKVINSLETNDLQNLTEIFNRQGEKIPC
jgi:NAD(P)-dependent dehydrogenase (short-subunit alcohol dehydrogenase family)